MIDSGSPVTIINQEELQKILQYEVFLYALNQRMKNTWTITKSQLIYQDIFFCELEVGAIT